MPCSSTDPDGRVIVLPKAELDRANEDTKHYPPTFEVCVPYLMLQQYSMQTSFDQRTLNSEAKSFPTLSIRSAAHKVYAHNIMLLILRIIMCSIPICSLGPRLSFMGGTKETPGFEANRYVACIARSVCASTGADACSDFKLEC